MNNKLFLLLILVLGLFLVACNGVLPSSQFNPQAPLEGTERVPDTAPRVTPSTPTQLPPPPSQTPQNTPTSQDKATELLNQVQEYLEGIHNTRFLIDTLALQALLNDATGEQPAALAGLEKALRLAQAGVFIRVFVDLGPQMAILLSR